MTSIHSIKKISNFEQKYRAFPIVRKARANCRREVARNEANNQLIKG